MSGNRNCTGLVLSLLALAAAPCLAHDAWIGLAGPPHRVHFGHGAGDAFDPAKLITATAFGGDGAPIALDIERHETGANLVPQAGAAMLAIKFDNGYWSRTGDGRSINQPRTEVTDAVRSSRAVKYTKTLLRWHATSTEAIGQRLELAPIATAAPGAGDVLTVRVLLEGQPLAGAQVEIGEGDGAVGRQSDAEGLASLPVSQGMVRVRTSHSLPYPGPEADQLNLAANLHFRVQ